MFTSRWFIVGVIAILFALAAFTGLAVLNANSVSNTRLGLSEQRIQDAEKANAGTRLGLSEQRLLNEKPASANTRLGLSEQRLLNTKDASAGTRLGLSEQRLLDAANH